MPYKYRKKAHTILKLTNKKLWTKIHMVATAAPPIRAFDGQAKTDGAEIRVEHEPPDIRWIERCCKWDH